MNAQWMKTRQTKYTVYAAVYIAVIVAVLGLANFLAQRYNKSWDSTANKQFSLSDQTVKVVKGLNQDVRITYFDRTNEITNPRGNARDLLDRYANLSPHVKVEYVDPNRKPEVAKAAGVRNYSTLFVDAGGRRQEAKSVSEEEVTGALVRAIKGGERMVCSVAGTGEHAFSDTERDGLSVAKELLERNNYKTQSINLLEKPEVPKECEVLLVAGPQLDYIQPVVDAIKSYIEGGGSALIAMDPPLKVGQEQAAENAALAGLLMSWGVTPNKDIVIDFSAANQLLASSRAVVLVNDYESHAIVRPLGGRASVMPLSRSLEVKNADKTTVEALFKSSEDSLATSNLSSNELDPNDKNNRKGPLTLAAAGVYNTGKENANGRFVVAGTSAFMANSALGSGAVANRDLFLNMMNWLSADEDLISIRPKEPENRPLMLNVRQMRVLMWSTLVGLPLIVIVAGLSVWWRRR